MGIVRFVAAASAVAAFSTGVSAQPVDRALTPLETAVACASPASIAKPSTGLRVTGSQDTVPRTVFGEKDMLVVNTGSEGGVRIDQLYYVRRPIFFGTSRTRMEPEGLTTGGWVRIVSVNEKMALASVEHICGAIFEGDYLEPFAAPTLPPMPDRELPFDELDFTSLGMVLLGTENHSSGGAGDLMTIDRGTDQGVAPGARFAIYRDVHRDGVPLSSIGEGIVLATGASTSLARITMSRDAVVSGDFVVPRK